MKKNCLYCGKEFEGNYRHKFCSSRCQNKNWKVKNRDKYLKLSKEYNARLRLDPVRLKRLQANQVKHNHTQKGRYTGIKAQAVTRGYNFDLTFDEFLTFWNKPCYYCHNKINGVGIDRLDNTKGYNLDNCVPCCIICNRAKNTLSVSDFISHCKKIVEIHSHNTN